MSVKVRELRPGKWYIVVHYGGKRWVQLVGTDKDEADKYANELRRELEFRGYGALARLKIGEPHDLLVGNYADRWVKEIQKSDLKLSTINSYKSNVRIHIKPAFGHLTLQELTYSRVKEFCLDKVEGTYSSARFRKNRSAEVEKKRPEPEVRKYSRDSIRLMLATLRAMLDEAVREELIDTNPVYRMGKFYRKAKPLREDPDPFSLEELHCVEASCAERWPEYYEFLLMMSRSGLRVGEAIAISLQDLDLEKRQAIIRQNMPIHRELGTPKTPASKRTVDLSPQLALALRSMLARRKVAWLEKGENETPDWLFCNSQGNPLDYSKFEKAFRRIQTRAKIERRRRVHDLRHSYATLSLLAGRPLAYVSAQLGHKSPQVTLQIYYHWVKGVSAPAGADALDLINFPADGNSAATDDNGKG
jgi:integrase